MSNDCVEVKAESIIDKRVSRLRNNQEEIEELVEQLYRQLSPIISPEAPSETSKSGDMPPSASVSSHALDLDLLGDRSTNTVRRLAFLAKRIEL